MDRVSWSFLDQLNSDPHAGYLLSESPYQSEYEMSAAILGHLVRRLTHPEVLPALASVETLPGSVTVNVAESASTDLHAELSVRHYESYREVLTARKPAHPGSQLTFKLPHIPGGNYVADVRLVDKTGCTHDWTAQVFEIVRSVRFNNLSVQPKVVSAGDKVTCSLDITGPTDGLKMHARWYDNWGRLLFQTSDMPFSATMVLNAPSSSMSVINRVEVALTSKAGVETQAEAEILMPDNTPKRDFYTLYWMSGGGREAVFKSWRSQLTCSALRKICLADGITNCGTDESTARMAALSGLRTIPYTTAYHQMTMEQLFPDPQKQTSMDWKEQSAKYAVRNHKPYGALGYTLGDENGMTWAPAGRFLDRPYIWKQFQDYLRQVYPDLSALNAQWGTNFLAWEDIRFSDEKSILASLDNPSSWVDYRMFISRAFAESNHHTRKLIEAESPGAVVGYDGTAQSSSYDGIDHWQLSRGMGMFNVYHHNFVPGVWTSTIFNGKAMESFAPDAVLKGCWFNNADFDYGGQFMTWYLLLHGWNSTWWWHATYPHPQYGALTWDGKIAPVVETVVRAGGEIKAGPGTLIAHAAMQTDPIAVHYSENNYHASTIEGGTGSYTYSLGATEQLWSCPSPIERTGFATEDMVDQWGGIAPKGHYSASSRDFYLLLHDLGFQPVTVARQEVEAGKLSSDRMKVLVLPFVASLSDVEAVKIREFVTAGGLLITDYRCGVRDLHSRIRDKGVLDDLFGIKRNSRDVRRLKGNVLAEDWAMDFAGSWESIFHEDITPDGANAIAWHDDGTPAVMLHRYGSGWAVYLNADIHCYEEWRRRGIEPGIREFFRKILLNYASIEAPFVPEYANGHPAPHTEVSRFRDGDAWYYGVIPDYTVYDKRDIDARLLFPSDKHVYDVRQGKYLGMGTVRTTLQAGIPLLYAALPSKVEALEVSSPAEVRRGEELRMHLEVQCEGGPTGPHAVRIECFRPDGSKPEYASEVVYLDTGKGSWTFLPALNEPVGRWRAVITEVASGVQTQAKWLLR